MMVYAGIFIIFMGVSIACSIFVGKYVGESAIAPAKLYAKVSTIYGLALAIILDLFLWIYNEDIASYFSTDTEI